MPPSLATCTCGATFPQRQGRGRQYKFCADCRPRRRAPRTETPTSPDWLLDLPNAIARAEEDGRPIIVELEPGTLDEPHQRLYATLGVLVRYVR